MPIDFSNIVTTGNRSYDASKSDGGHLNTPKTWDSLSMSEKSDIIKVGVRNGLHTMSDIRNKYNEFAQNPGVHNALTEAYSYINPTQLDEVVVTPSNEKAYGGNLFVKGGNTGKQAFLSYLDQTVSGNRVFDNAQYRKYFTDLAAMESSYKNPYITNDIGASGYFQLMPGNRARSWSNPTQQFYEMYNLTKNNLDYLTRNLTEKDWERARELGIDIYGLLAGAHLGGVDGVMKALRGQRNAKDKNGTSVMNYMTRFSQNGAVSDYNNAPAFISQENPYPIPIATYTPEDFQLTEQPLVDDANEYVAQEMARQEKVKKLNALTWILGMTSPEGQKNPYLDVLSAYTSGNPLAMIGNINAEGGQLNANYYGLGDKLKKAWNWISNAAQVGQIAENPAVMTASGYRVNRDGKAVQDKVNTKDAKQLRENLATLGDGALMGITAPGDIAAIYQVARHPVQTAKAVKQGVQAASKAVKRAAQKRATVKTVEKERKDLLKELNSSWYKDRWKNSTSLENNTIDDIVSDMSTLTKEAPVNYSRSSTDMSSTIGRVKGITAPRPPVKIYYNGKPATEYNTGLDVYIGNDLGNTARGTGYHELQHYITGNSHGIFSKYGKPSYSGVFNTVPIDYGDSYLVPRGKAYQHFIMNQNESLLPPKNPIYDMAINNPENLERLLINTGHSPETAKNTVQLFNEEGQYMMDLQESRAHLKTWFNQNILPYLKGPNDPEEIIQILKADNNSIWNSRPSEIKKLTNILRPGSIEDYAKYFAGALSVAPIVPTVNK